MHQTRRFFTLFLDYNIFDIIGRKVYEFDRKLLFKIIKSNIHVRATTLFWTEKIGHVQK